MDLDREVDHPLRDAGRGDLDLRHRRPGTGDAMGVEQPRGVQHEQAQLVDGDAGVGDAFAVAAQVDQRFTEREALGAAADRQLERGLRETDQTHAVMHPARPEPTLCNLETASGTGDDRVEWKPHVGERHLAVPTGLVVEAHRREHPLDFHAGGVHRDQHHRMSLVLVCFRVGEAHEDEDLAVRAADAGAPPLAPVQHHLVALDDRGGGHVGGIGRRDPGFGHTERRANLAVQQRLQPPLLLRGAAVVVEHLHVAGVRCVAVEHRGHEGGAAHLLGERRIFDVAQAGTEFGVGQEEIPQTLVPGLRLQRAELVGHLPHVGSGDVGPLRERVDPRGPQPGLDGSDLGRDELTQSVEVLLRPRARGEIHAASVTSTN